MTISVRFITLLPSSVIPAALRLDAAAFPRPLFRAAPGCAFPSAGEHLSRIWPRGLEGAARIYFDLDGSAAGRIFPFSCQRGSRSDAAGDGTIIHRIRPLGVGQTLSVER